MIDMITLYADAVTGAEVGGDDVLYLHKDGAVFFYFSRKLYGAVEIVQIEYSSGAREFQVKIGLPNAH